MTHSFFWCPDWLPTVAYCQLRPGTDIGVCDAANSNLYEELKLSLKVHPNVALSDAHVRIAHGIWHMRVENFSRRRM